MPIPSSLQDSARAEAAAWYLRLHYGPPSEGDHTAFDRWLRQDAAHGRAWARVERAEQALAALAALPEIAAMRAQALTQPSSRPTFGRWAIAAAMVAAIGLSVEGVLPDRNRPGRVEATRQESVTDYTSAPGERRSIVLSDGSRVTLDTASRIRVALGEAERRVTLVAGQAFFRVAHDAAHPFVVSVGGAKVTAVGTAFDVRADEGRVSVALIQGKVRVALPVTGEQVMMDPGTSLVISGKDLVKRDKIPGNATEWLQGRVRFDGTPLATAIAEMNRYGGPRLVLGDPAPQDREISGLFRTDGAAQLAQALVGYRIARISAQSADRIILVRY